MSKPVTPLLTVDIIIQMNDRPGHPVVVIERRYPPYGWALPGGFVDVGETLETAARREASEETQLEVTLTALLGCYSDPGRDARGHAVSAVFVATARGDPIAADDAKSCRVVAPPQTPTMAFDHGHILADYERYLLTGERPNPIRSSHSIR